MRPVGINPVEREMTKEVKTPSTVPLNNSKSDTPPEIRVYQSKYKAGKYTLDMPDRLIEFFSRPLRVMKKTQQVTRSGEVIEVEQEVFNDPPFIESFCAEQMIGKNTFYEWLKRYPDLRDAFNAAKQMQARALLTGAMQNGYNATISKLVLSCCTDYKEAKEDSGGAKITIKLDKEDEKL